MKRTLFSGATKYDPTTLWRLPASLSLTALLILPLASLISGYESGSIIRDGLAGLMALGACSCILGLGLGLWIGLRTRKWPAVLTAIASLMVATVWWQMVFWPMIEG